MSMLSRALAKSKAKPGSEEQKRLVAESMDHAKEAVKLDVTDGASWYAVGMAYMAAFFADGASDATKLAQSLKAYRNAENGGPSGDGSVGGGGVGDSPDLHFNRAIVHRYVEEYGAALEGFRRAAALDPALPWRAEVDAVAAALTRLDDGCRGAGPMFKPKRLAPIVKALLAEGAGREHVPKDHARASLRALREGAGANEGAATSVRVVVDATSSDAGGLNVHYVVVDAEGTLCALSVYGLEDGAVRHSSTLTLLCPNVRDVDATFEGRRFAFRLIRVDSPRQILVGGAMPVGRIARPRLASTNL
jgi:tetratricopeptide (TPR) repeat protein